MWNMCTLHGNLSDCEIILVSMLTQSRYSGIWVDCLEPVLLLLILEYIDGMESIVQAQLFHEDGHLPACNNA